MTTIAAEPIARPRAPPRVARQNNRQHLTICLLCSGSGGSDPSVYRPSRDDARYRHRHDALARCVASSLHGGAGAAARARVAPARASRKSKSREEKEEEEEERHGEDGEEDRPTGGGCELVFVYDGDLSCFRMSLPPPSSASSLSSSPPRSPPLEVDVVTSWREASREAMRGSLVAGASSSAVGSILIPRRHHQAGGSKDDGDQPPRLRTTCVLDLWTTVGPSSSSSSSPSFGSSRGAPAASPSSASSAARGGKVAPPSSTGEDRGGGWRPPLPSRMPSSKREAVVALQRSCPVEYLREHRLNVSCDVALRKFNLGKLRKVWEDYGKGGASIATAGGGGCAVVREVNERREDGGGDARGEGAEADDEEWQDRMERTFRAILSSRAKGQRDDDGDVMASNGDDRPMRVIAAYLHESCDAELPCWGWDRHGADNIDDDDDAVEEVFLFLGAVRDMTESENRALSRACSALAFPLVPCRLSPVPEFTSKILSVAGYHFFRRVLGGGLVELWRRRHYRLPREMNSVTSLPSTCPQSYNRTIHAIAMVPMGSQSLSADPSRRNRAMWCMVRLCVCSLWRSRLASDSSSSSSSSPEALNNLLTFLFEDGVGITLSQKEFTSSMAGKHRAAPSERQILEELCGRRDALTSMPDGKGIKQICKDILLSSMPSSGDDNRDIFALDFTVRCDKPNGHSSRELMNLAYSNRRFQTAAWGRQRIPTSWTLFTILNVRSDLKLQSCDDESTKRTEMIYKVLMRSISKVGIQVINQTSLLGHTSQDDEACTITMLQHVDYQGYLYQLLSFLCKDENDDDIIGKDPKLKKKEKKKRKLSCDN